MLSIIVVLFFVLCGNDMVIDMNNEIIKRENKL